MPSSPSNLIVPVPERDFAAIAALLTSFETEPTSESSLLRWYQRELEQGLRMYVAQDESGAVAGFHCLYRRGDPADKRFNLYLIVAPQFRCQGLGARLYLHLEQIAAELEARQLFAAVRDNDTASLEFAKRRSYRVRGHSIEMALELSSFDSTRFDGLIARLQENGFCFTNMAELGNGEEARRKLYQLNDSTAATTPGSEGEHPWISFEDFDRSVCQSNWYLPEGQVVAIDTGSGAWAGMSAITRFEGADHAYNLFTGVDPAYRGRGLGKAVKVLALRYAARRLGVNRVRTNHNALNAPMIAIDRKIGYEQTPGMYGLVKVLREEGE